MFKWLKQKIEINNRRNANDDTDWTGEEAWSMASFIIVYLLGLAFIIVGVILAITKSPAACVLSVFGLILHVWQFWHLLFYYGPEYDDDYKVTPTNQERTEQE